LTAAVTSLTKLLKPHPHRELFGALADSVEDGVLVLDGTGRSVLAANHAFLLLTGYTRRELERLTAEALFPPETRFADSPGTLIPELPTRTHAGESLDLDVWPYPIGSPPSAILLKARASAVRERTMKRARLEEDRLAHLIEISAQIAESAVDPGLTFFDLARQVLSANYVGVYRASPHSEDYLLGGTLPKDFPLSLPPASFDPLDRPSLWSIGTRPQHPLHKAARAAGLKALRSSPLGSLTTWIGLLVAGWQDPADVPPEVTGLMEVLANLCHARILMEMHREVVAELEGGLDQARRELSSSFQAVQEGLISLDSNLKVMRANSAACQILGYHEGQLKGQAIQDVLVGPADIMTTMLDALGHQLTAERSQLMLHRRDGRPFPASLRAVPQEEGQVSRLILVLNDLSERKAIEDQTETLAQRALLGEVAAIFAHEVRNPINNISTGLQLAASRLGREHPQHDALEVIRSECKRLDQLMDDVLFFARPLELKFTPLNLADLVDRILARWGPRLKLAKVGTHTNYANGRARVLADERTIEQVIVNLITNSVQAMAEGGTLSVHITADGSSGQLLKIADTGPGIRPEQLDRIFDPFFTTKKSGTGLGLAISRRFCRMLGGDIAVESVAGEGSVFIVTLPADVSEARPAPAETPPEAEAPAPCPSALGVVLAIDDDPSVLDLVRRFLGKEGFDVRTATSGQEGLALARTLRPAVITLDVMMPGMDGWAVLAALKADPDLAGIPVVMVTIMDDKEMGFALGAVEYLTKPVDRGQLTAVVRRLRADDGTAPVLVVDDDPSVRELMRRALEKEGFGVDEAEHGRAALERVRHRVPALILLDLMMPEMDGFEFVAELRRHAEWRRIPVIIVTAKELTGDERARLNGQVERILQKGSSTRDSLLGEIRDMVAACLPPPAPAAARRP